MTQPDLSSLALPEAGPIVFLGREIYVQRVAAGRYSVRRIKRKGAKTYRYAGDIWREGRHWGISGPDIGIARYPYDTLRSAIADFQREMR